MTAQPAVSVLLIAYNHSQFVGEAIDTILAQRGVEFEVVASDDCSPDDTLAVMERAAATAAVPFVVRATPRNGGLGANINHAVSLARGDILIICAGDDRFAPQRFAKLVAAFADAEVFAVTSDAMKIDADGKELGYELGWQHGEAVTAAPFVVPGVATNGAAMAYRRAVFDFFGPLAPGVNWEDQVLPFRAALLGRVAWIKEPLVEHRYHGANMSMPLDWQAVEAAEFARRWHEASVANSRVLGQKLKDLDLLLARQPQRQAELRSLRRDLERSLNLQRLGGTLRDRPWQALGRLLLWSLRGQVSLAQAAKQFLMGRFPGFWLWYMRRRGGAG